MLCIQHSTAECITHTNAVDNVVDIEYSCIFHAAIRVKHSGKGMMFRAHHVTQGNIYVFAIWNLLTDCLTKLFVSFYIVCFATFCCLKSWGRNSSQQSIFSFTTKHDITAHHQWTKHFLCTLTIIPKVLSVVYVV